MILYFVPFARTVNHETQAPKHLQSPQLNRKACAVVLFGAGAEELHRLITGANFSGELTRRTDLTSAVEEAVRSAEALGASSLLLSPACASFDQYRDFEARGDHFKQLIHQVQRGLS